jgi:hypothetical protein
MTALIGSLQQVLEADLLRKLGDFLGSPNRPRVDEDPFDAHRKNLDDYIDHHARRIRRERPYLPAREARIEAFKMLFTMVMAQNLASIFDTMTWGPTLAPMMLLRHVSSSSPPFATARDVEDFLAIQEARLMSDKSPPITSPAEIPQSPPDSPPEKPRQ